MKYSLYHTDILNEYLNAVGINIDEYGSADKTRYCTHCDMIMPDIIRVLEMPATSNRLTMIGNIKLMEFMGAWLDYITYHIVMRYEARENEIGCSEIHIVSPICFYITLIPAKAGNEYYLFGENNNGNIIHAIHQKNIYI